MFVVVLPEESAVGGFVFIDRDAKDDAVARGDALLKLDEGGGFFDARRAPGGPEIKDDDFSLILLEAGGLAVGERELDIFSGFSGHGGFALAIVGEGEKVNDAEGESHAAPSEHFAHDGIHT